VRLIIRESEAEQLPGFLYFASTLLIAEILPPEAGSLSAQAKQNRDFIGIDP